MPYFHESSFPAHEVQSLTWVNDTLVDWVGGGSVYHLDGTFHRSDIHFAYRFDAATVSPSGAFAVIYERCGTKGIILDDKRDIVREINRSFYYAHAYEYPVALWCLPTGQEVIAHCPDQYNRLEIDDVLTGARLTHAPNRKPIDMFFSRLTTDASGTYLLNAGWVWQPLDVVSVYPIADVLTDPSLLDGYGIAPRTMAEVSTGVFGTDQTLILGTSDEDTAEPDATEAERIADPLGFAKAPALAVYDLATQQYRSITPMNMLIGAVMPVTAQYVVSFYDHPKLIDVSTGQILHRWEHLHTGQQVRSITWGRTRSLPLAIDAAKHRFAVASDASIMVIRLDPDALP